MRTTASLVVAFALVAVAPGRAEAERPGGWVQLADVHTHPLDANDLISVRPGTPLDRQPMMLPSVVPSGFRYMSRDPASGATSR